MTWSIEPHTNDHCSHKNSSFNIYIYCSVYVFRKLGRIYYLLIVILWRRLIIYIVSYTGSKASQSVAHFFKFKTRGDHIMYTIKVIIVLYSLRIDEDRIGWISNKSWLKIHYYGSSRGAEGPYYSTCFIKLYVLCLNF